jgi:hypothetical protein
VLEGRHGGLVGTRALGEENGPCLLYGYDYGFVFEIRLLPYGFVFVWLTVCKLFGRLNYYL